MTHLLVFAGGLVVGCVLLMAWALCRAAALGDLRAPQPKHLAELAPMPTRHEGGRR